MLHDTAGLNYKREDIDAVGETRINITGAYQDGPPRDITACAILMHSSLAIRSEGLPLGLAAI